jgi:hypothetical protein
MAEIVYKKLNQLKLLGNNPRQIQDADFQRLCESLERNPDYFEARPVILSNRTGDEVIIAGNMRYRAAKKLKLKEVPTILLSDLTEEREAEIIFRDNINNGQWDLDRYWLTSGPTSRWKIGGLRYPSSHSAMHPKRTSKPQPTPSTKRRNFKRNGARRAGSYGSWASMTNGVVSRFWCWEPLLFFGDAWPRKRPNDVFDFPIGQQKETANHPCPKPLKMWGDLIENYSEPSDLIFDSFVGSGTTLIACEERDRRCRGMEISPEYIAVALERWHNLTGKQPELIEQAGAADA